MIIGIGVDTVGIDRFERQLARTPSLRERLFTEAERDLPVASLAARFAAKEAMVKALGGSAGLGWHDIEVRGGRGCAPSFARGAALTEQFAASGVADAHLSIAHDAGIATAFVVLEGEGPG